MLREAFEFLFKIGRDSVPAIVRAEAEPAHVYYMRDEAGKLTRTVAEAGPVTHHADDLGTLAQIADTDPKSVAWVRPNGVALAFGDQARSRALMQLPFSAPFFKLATWAKERPQLSQASLINELRSTFFGCLGAHPDLLAVLRKVRFNLNQQTVGEVAHGKSSLGKTIEGEVYGTGAIPETITVNVPVYASPALLSIRADVKCLLNPDPATGNFQVIPIPGELENASQFAVAMVADMIARGFKVKGPRVLFGAP